MGILSWIILGGLAGWLASMVVGNNAQQGLLGNIVVGIVGALIGGFIFGLLQGEDFSYTEFSLGNLLVALAGSVVLLMILKAIRGKS